VIRVAVVAAALVLALAAAATASSTVDVRVAGTEVPPISSTLGTFVGTAHGGLLGAWRIQIAHEPLRTGPVVAITGGTFSLLTRDGHRVGSRVLGGSVTVMRAGGRCGNQVYAVTVQLADGTFAGTLTHRRHTLLGRCLIYAATISGRASLTA
jgi:hypothetical protein